MMMMMMMNFWTDAKCTIFIYLFVFDTCFSCVTEMNWNLMN